MTNFEILSSAIELREASDGANEIAFRAVDFQRHEVIPGYAERYEARSFGDPIPAGQPLKDGHTGASVGVVKSWEVRSDGIYGVAKLSKTAPGNDAAILLRDGVYHSVSIEYVPTKNGLDSDGTYVRSAGKLIGVALTGQPALPNSRVLAMRDATKVTADHSAEKEDEMPNEIDVETRDAVSAMQSELVDVKRQLAANLALAPVGAVVKPEFRSMGHLVKEIVAGNEDAIQFANQRVYTGGVVADSDVQPAFIQTALKIVNQGRVSLSAFSQAPLPASGTVFPYKTVSADTTTVAKQNAEGDVLAGPGKVTLADASSNLETYGGYTILSRQEIERSDENMLDITLQAIQAKYAAVTNARFRTVLASSVSTTIAGGAVLGSMNAAKWDAAILAAEVALGTSGYNFPAEFVLVSTDVYSQLAGLRVSDQSYLSRPGQGAGTNAFGNLNPNALRGEINGLPIILDVSLANGSCYVANSAAMRTLEQAPTQLSDQDVTTLTSTFSVYGYLSVQAPFATLAARKVTFA